MELGARWVLGKEENPLWDIVKNKAFKGITTDYKSVTFRNAQGLDVTWEAAVSGRRLNSVKDRIKILGENLRQFDSEDIDVLSALRYYGWQAKTAVEKAVEYFTYDFRFSDIPRALSVKFMSLGSWNRPKKEDFFVNDPRGFCGIVDELVDEIKKYSKLNLLIEEVVTQINYNGSRCSVQTEKGKVLTGDFCINTVSLGVLQAESISFNPKLPDWKRKSIHKHVITDHASIYLQFPHNTSQFWNNTQHTIYAGATRGRYVVWHNLEHSGLFPPGSNIFMTTAEGEVCSNNR